MATPTPVFPGAIATDAQLKVANNLITTTLQVGAGSTDTILFVASAAGFVPNSLVSIENEIVAIASVVTSGNPQLIVAAGGRGFDGTTAAAHSAGVNVSMYIDAWHHNVLATEIKAIEGFIGPNGSNIGSGYPFLVSVSFQFAPQSPGGSLVTGNNVVNLSPVPKGVNGSDANHYLYISGGTGAAEAVLITGGTAVSGQPSGTVIVNCANAHSGAWTIASATGGLQEAVNYATDGTAIVIPTDITLYANVVSAGRGASIYKFAGVSITNAATYRIFTSKNSWGVTAKAETISTDGISLAGASSADTTLFSGNPYAGAAISAARSTNHTLSASTEEDCMWVQEGFYGPTGTPVALRSVLFAPNLTNSQGACSLAGYAYLGWTTTNAPGSGTEAFGCHGQCDVYNGAAGFQNTAVGLNAEGSYLPLGTDPGPQPTLIGVVSNMGAGSTGNATMMGVQVISNPNPGGAANTEGGIKVHAVTSGTHQYGLKIYDDGGQYLQPVIITTSQANSPTVNICNSTSGTGAGTSSINFFRGDLLAVHQLAGISVANTTDFGSGVLKIATANASTLTTVVTIDQAQVVTVAKSVRTTGITVAQLPPSASNIGSWACVTDATVTTAGTIVAGGGSNTVGVFCGTAGWRIVSN